jgi:peptidoglycan/LPS O-acetylase OafA/YrhL
MTEQGVFVNEAKKPDSSALARNPGIDLLRGLSIVLVILLHIGLRIPLKHSVLATFAPMWLLNAAIDDGYEAVFMFFVISGFLIASNTLARWGTPGRIDVRAFYARRAARIVPLLLILVAVLSLLHVAGVQEYVIRNANQSLPRAVFSALGLHLNWYEGHTGYLPGSWDVLWSLSVEEVFYLCFPLVCLLLRRNWILAPGMLLLALSLPVSRAALHGNQIWKEKAYLPGMAAIATGVLGAVLASQLQIRRRSVLGALYVVSAAGIGMVLFFGNVLWHWMRNGTLLVLTFSTLCLLLAFHWQARLRAEWRIPGAGWLRSCGRLSYEIYLTHMSVVWLVLRAYQRTGAGQRWGFLWYLPVLGFSWLLGWLVAKYVSTPSERAMRRWLMRDEPRIQATAAAMEK